MPQKDSIGQKGEEIAREFLIRNGHEILFQNFRFERKEVDIISLWKNILIFTEVKTRSSFQRGFPEESVSAAKQQSIKMVADYFLLENPQYSMIRFDIISVIIYQNKLMEIKHFEDAFY